jgi:hypothetical protein
MSLQIFKQNIPNNLIFDLFEVICLKNKKYYTFNVESYKKGVYKEIIQQFIEKCRPYYHISKRKYLDRKLTYNSFTTILRQICNSNKIIYTTKIKYDKSVYNILYYIYF